MTPRAAAVVTASVALVHALLVLRFSQRSEPDLLPGVDWFGGLIYPSWLVTAVLGLVAVVLL
jgi:hypothetical protein